MTPGAAQSRQTQRKASPVAGTRKKLGKSKYSERFAAHLRSLLDARDIGPTEFAERLEKAGVPVGPVAVKTWLNGTRMPKVEHLIAVGKAAGLKNPRDILPL